MRKHIPPSEPPKGTKWCPYTQHFVKLSEFNRDTKSKDGLQTHCKECKVLIRIETVKKKKEKGVDYTGTKECNTCGLNKSKKEFYIDWRNSDCLNNICKECESNRLRKRKENLIPITEPDLTTYKECTKCKQPKLGTEFYRDKFRKDGLQPWCKECMDNIVNTHQKANREQYNRISLEWRRNRTPEQKQLMSETIARWKRNNKEKVQTYSANRRVLINVEMSKLDIEISAEYRIAISNDPCYYCNQHKQIMHVDHYIPIARGGTNHWWNLVRACADCNLSKGTLTGDEFINKLNSTLSQTPHIPPLKNTYE